MRKGPLREGHLQATYWYVLRTQLFLSVIVNRNRVLTANSAEEHLLSRVLLNKSREHHYRALSNRPPLEGGPVRGPPPPYLESGHDWGYYPTSPRRRSSTILHLTQQLQETRRLLEELRAGAQVTRRVRGVLQLI